jgi:pimeloyl-ACP methyl ester carboxylesterase
MIAYSAPISRSSGPDALPKVNLIQLPSGQEIAWLQSSATGVPVVFVHGLASRGSVWDSVIALLSTRFRCISLDLPGYGDSPGADSAGTIDGFADVLHAFLAALHLPAVHLVAHSMGGQIAIRFAFRFPYRIQRMVLAAPAGLETFTAMQRMLVQTQMTSFPMLSTAMIQSVAASLRWAPGGTDGARLAAEGQPAQLDAQSQRHLARSISGMISDPVFEELPFVPQPTLVILGGRDRIIPNQVLNSTMSVDSVAESARRMPRSEVVIYPDNGHFLQLEAPEAFSAAVEKFLSQG